MAPHPYQPFAPLAGEPPPSGGWYQRHPRIAGSAYLLLGATLAGGKLGFLPTFAGFSPGPKLSASGFPVIVLGIVMLWGGDRFFHWFPMPSNGHAALAGRTIALMAALTFAFFVAFIGFTFADGCP